MEATSFGLSVSPLPSTLPATDSSSYRSRLSPSPHLRPPRFAVKGARIFASADDSKDEGSAGLSTSTGLSVDELEQKLGKRRRSRKQKPSAERKPPPKDWESMTLAEKAWDLYVGEKGALFWLNKAAYAAIFVVVGGWIVFWFVGPALNLYQLDSPLLPPTEVFTGSK
ncbi:hypothetical protein L7F22_014651 [Adiantum nelumboides]|nr:hypothetical protein [Adiantum nelumboides]